MIRHFSHIRLVEAETFMLMRPGRARGSDIVFGPGDPPIFAEQHPWVVFMGLDDDARDLAHVVVLHHAKTLFAAALSPAQLGWARNCRKASAEGQVREKSRIEVRESRNGTIPTEWVFVFFRDSCES